VLQPKNTINGTPKAIYGKNFPFFFDTPTWGIFLAFS